MSKMAQMLIEEQWGYSFFEEQKELNQSQTGWGNRDNLIKIGKTIASMKWHAKPKRFYSPAKQMDLYFGWLREVTDQRTRRIITGQLINYYVPLNDEQYEELKDRREIQFRTFKTLEFDMESIPLDHEFQMAAMFSDLDPFDSYNYWIEKGTDKQKQFAEQYGTITDVQIPMLKQDSMSHRFYTLSRALKYLSGDYREKIDCYFNTSMTYQKASKKDFKRSGDRVTEYCLLFSELDYYKLEKYKDKTQKEMLQLIYEKLDRNGFPRPTEEVYPRGLHLVWKINPIQAYRVFEWEMMQEKIHELLEEFGSDKQTIKDKVRLLRLVGTIHSKTGKKVHGVSYTDDRYSFDELMSKFCAEELEKEKEKRKSNREKYLKRLEKQAKEAKEKPKELQVIQGGNKGFTKQSTEKETLHDSNYVGNLIHEKYKRDLVHLVDLRDGEMKGLREFSCFLVRYWTLCLTGSSVKALNEMQKLYYSMNIEGDYTLSEIISRTKSAETAYKRWKENWQKGYNYRNDKLVDFLKITKEEQKSMWILMDDEETKARARKRDAVKKKNKRKAEGAIANDELEAAIKEEILKDPQLGLKKIAEKVRERLGKCSDRKVSSVKQQMKNDGEI